MALGGRRPFSFARAGARGESECEVEPGVISPGPGDVRWYLVPLVTYKMRDNTFQIDG